MTPKTAKHEKRVVQVLFLLVVLTFVAAERASGLFKYRQDPGGVPTALRTAPGAAATTVSIH